jgi:hypothetical protein
LSHLADDSSLVLISRDFVLAVTCTDEVRTIELYQFINSLCDEVRTISSGVVYNQEFFHDCIDCIVKTLRTGPY